MSRQYRIFSSFLLRSWRVSPLSAIEDLRSLAVHKTFYLGEKRRGLLKAIVLAFAITFLLPSDPLSAMLRQPPLEDSAQLVSTHSVELKVSPLITDEAFKEQVKNKPHLEKLDLTGCGQILETSIEEAVQGLPKLRELNLSDCTQVSDIMVEFLIECLGTSLKKLDLTGVAGLRRATFVKIQQAGIAFNPQEGINENLDCSSLKAFNDKALQEQLILNPNIQKLNLKGCRFITDAGLKHLLILKELETLDIRGCTRLTDDGINFLTTLSLKELHSDHSVETEPVLSTALQAIQQDPIIINFSNHGDLTDDKLKAALEEKPLVNILNLKGCYQLTDEGLKHVAKLPHLTSLTLTGCRFEALGQLVKLSSLTSLNLSNCDITTVELMHVTQLMGLTSLNLSGCHQVTDKGLTHVAHLTNLITLHLGCCGLTNAKIAEIRNTLKNTDIYQ
jgi:F-box/leucine-rich repeat protein 14